MALPVFANLKQWKYLFLFLGVSFLFFDLSYYLMWKLPGSRGEMCVMGANITPENLGFSTVSSLMSGLVFTGLLSLFALNAARRKMALSSLSGMAWVLGVLTVFCPVCSLPAISLFGFTFGFEMFNDFNLYFKTGSLILLVLALFLLNKQLKSECERCTVYIPPGKGM